MGIEKKWGTRLNTIFGIKTDDIKLNFQFGLDLLYYFDRQTRGRFYLGTGLHYALLESYDIYSYRDSLTNDRVSSREWYKTNTLISKINVGYIHNFNTHFALGFELKANIYIIKPKDRHSYIYEYNNDTPPIYELKNVYTKNIVYLI